VACTCVCQCYDDKHPGFSIGSIVWWKGGQRNLLIRGYGLDGKVWLADYPFTGGKAPGWAVPLEDLSIYRGL